jgi:hypothetical protein
VLCDGTFYERLTKGQKKVIKYKSQSATYKRYTLENNEFLETAMGLDGLAGLRLLIEQVVSPSSALRYFGGFERLPVDIPDDGLHFGVEQSVARLRAELAAVRDWTDKEADARLATLRRRREEHNAEDAGQLEVRLAAVRRILGLVLRWHPQLDDSEALERAEIMRAVLIARLVEIREWATRVWTTSNGELPGSGGAYREAEIVRLCGELNDAMARVTALYSEYRSQLPVLLDLRRFLAEAVGITA